MTTPNKMIEDAFPQYHLMDLPMYHCPTEDVEEARRTSQYSPPLLTHEFKLAIGENFQDGIREELAIFIADTEEKAIAAVGDLNPATMLMVVFTPLQCTTGVGVTDAELRLMRDGVEIPCKFDWGFSIRVAPLPEDEAPDA